jgi:maleate isomerase
MGHELDRKVWAPDGAGWRAQIGLVTPDNDPIPESEFWTLAPEGVSVSSARMVLNDTLTYHEPPGPDNAIALLARLPLHSIVFAFTTTSYILGAGGRQALKARLEEASKGIPVLLTGDAATAACRALRARRIALIHPPWFTQDVVEKGAEYFRHEGFDIVHASHLTPPRKQTEVDPGETYAWVRNHVPSNAEAVFIGGNGYRTIGVIAALEEDLGRPVLTGNQVALWYALRLAGVGATVEGYGQVFTATRNGEEEGVLVNRA